MLRLAYTPNSVWFIIGNYRLWISFERAAVLPGATTPFHVIRAHRMRWITWLPFALGAGLGRPDQGKI